MKGKYLFVLIFIYFFSCDKNQKNIIHISNEQRKEIISESLSDKNDNKIKKSENKNVTKYILNRNESLPKTSIFYYLFSDIKSNIIEYNNDKNFSIKVNYPRKENPNDYLLPDKEILVENDYIKIHFLPAYYRFLYQDISDVFLPLNVEILKQTNDFFLGKYIGEDIKVLTKDFGKESDISNYDNSEYTFYCYRNEPENWINIWVKGNIIKKIEYGSYD